MAAEAYAALLAVRPSASEKPPRWAEEPLGNSGDDPKAQVLQLEAQVEELRAQLAYAELAVKRLGGPPLRAANGGSNRAAGRQAERQRRQRGQ
jgi:hypothetical protein